MSASDRRWQERYKTIQERKWQTPGRRESRRRDRQYQETYTVPEEETWLDDWGLCEARNRSAADIVYEWVEDAVVQERTTVNYNDYIPQSYVEKLMHWFADDAPTRVRDLKDDVSLWDASDLSGLFA